MRVFPALAALALALPAFAQDGAEKPKPVTPASVIAEAPEADWRAIAPEDLMVMQLAPTADGKPRTVVIQLMPPPFSQGWVANIRTLAKAHWWDGTTVYRVVDNWVTQWGDVTEEKALPEGILAPVQPYVVRTQCMTFAEEGGEETDFACEPIGYPGVTFTDPYTRGGASFSRGWPVAWQPAADGANLVSPLHCYGMIGVARSTDTTGTGSELYTVIGHAPRQLDRNIALVGRVIEGMEFLSSLPRGHGDGGVYEGDEEKLRVPILSVRLMSELIEEENKERGLYLGGSRWPSYQYLSTESDSFARYVAARANRNDDFYKVPAGGVDICNVPVPVRGLMGQ